MDEIEWEKHWLNFKKWVTVDGKWRDETLMLDRAKIRSYLSAPQVVGFGGWKEEAAKFIESRYYNEQMVDGLGD